MFCLMSGLPPFAIGITATGMVTADDFKQVLQPQLQKVTGNWKGVNLLLVLETDLKNFTAGAWLQDAKTNVGYFLKWNKVAVVSQSGSMEKMTALFDKIIPGEAKMFPHSELAEAKEWIAVP